MYLRTIVMLLVLGALTIFATINWHAFVTPTTLSLGFTNVEAPLGLILLGVVGALTLLFLVYVVYLQSSALMENRRHARELQTQREIADQAEASRVAQLHSFLESGLQNLAEKGEASRLSVLARLDQMEREVRSAVEQSGNTLAAYIGEIDDRLDRVAAKESSR